MIVVAVVSMTKMSVNCVLVVTSLLVSWFSTSLYVKGKREKEERRGEGERERALIMKNISSI